MYNFVPPQVLTLVLPSLPEQPRHFLKIVFLRVLLEKLKISQNLYFSENVLKQRFSDYFLLFLSHFSAIDRHTIILEKLLHLNFSLI